MWGFVRDEYEATSRPHLETEKTPIKDTHPPFPNTRIEPGSAARHAISKPCRVLPVFEHANTR